MTNTQPTWIARNYSRIAWVAITVAALGVLAESGSGFGYRLGFLSLQTALQQMLPAGAYIAAGGAVLCVIVLALGAALHKEAFLKRSAPVIVALAASAIAAYLPYSMRASAAGLPPIHDITTDTENPPMFVDVVPLRAQTGAVNPPEYLRDRSGRRTLNVPEAQKNAYPDIQTLTFEGVAPAAAYARALAAVKQTGWTLVADKPEEGRIEAFDRTFWFGFYDDVVIRVTPTETGSKIDIRSKSRVGGGDVGTNARRVRSYIKRLMAIPS